MRAYRPDKMASLIREVVSELMTTKLQDPRISPFASITRVEVTGDLSIAKVYISVMGSDADSRTTLRGLENAHGPIQRAVARAVNARVCPQVRFILDPSIKKAGEIIALIDANVPRLTEDAAPDDEALDDEVWDDDGDDADDIDGFAGDEAPADGDGPGRTRSTE